MTQNKNFSWLLVALLVFLAGIAVFDDTGILDPRIMRLLTISWLLVVGVWSLRGFGVYFKVGIGLAVVGVILNAVAVNSTSGVGIFGSFAALMGFLCIAIWCVLKQIAITNVISANRIIGAVSLYLLLGVFWAVAYTVVEIANPGSFDGLTVRYGQGWDSDWLYFSFVTMTTLGYGDMLPLSAIARMLAYVQAVFGQFYIAILVAGLVSAYLSRRQGDVD
jgi:hypothetical protein